MKTALIRLKAIVKADDTLNGYVNNVKIVAPRSLPLLDQSLVPFIGFAPINSPEQWVSTGKKDDTNTIEAYLVNLHLIEEESLIGSDDRKGMLDLVENFKTAVRGSFLPDDDDTYYLSKPLDITGVDYATAEYGDGYYLLIATVTLSAIRLFAV